jgi:hypothetical protein
MRSQLAEKLDINIAAETAILTMFFIVTNKLKKGLILNRTKPFSHGTDLLAPNS